MYYIFETDDPGMHNVSGFFRLTDIQRKCVRQRLTGTQRAGKGKIFPYPVGSVPVMRQINSAS